MDQQLKQRLVGAAVLVALGVIFIPVLLDDSVREEPGIRGSNIPPKPAEEFSSRIIPLEPEPPPDAPPPDPEEPAEAGPASPGEQAGPGADAGARAGAGPAAGQTPRVGVTAWVIQIGSFSSEDNARALEERLREAGYAAFVETFDADSGTVYRVRVGPELLHADAEALRERLATELELDGMVMRYP